MGFKARKSGSRAPRLTGKLYCPPPARTSRRTDRLEAWSFHQRVHFVIFAKSHTEEPLYASLYTKDWALGPRDRCRRALGVRGRPARRRLRRARLSAAATSSHRCSESRGRGSRRVRRPQTEPCPGRATRTAESGSWGLRKTTSNLLFRPKWIWELAPVLNLPSNEIRFF